TVAEPEESVDEIISGAWCVVRGFLRCKNASDEAEPASENTTHHAPRTLLATTHHVPRTLVAERHLDRHPILRHCSLLEDIPRFLDKLLGTDRVACRDVRQHEAPSLGRQRHLRRLARRRMPRLLGPVLFFLPKGRLVNQ